MSARDIESVRQRLGDRYVIERELGRGGMGTVYLARDVRLDRAVALKVLPPAFAMDGALRERFLRETRTSASFSHPNIVPVHAIEESDELVAFAMGYVEGESLAERVRRLGPLGVRDLVRLLQDIGYALAYAHGRGVVHRDLKPDNVMIERATGRALLMDFGISRAIVTAPGAAAGLTRVGEVVGTPEYMSPEQASGDTVDGRSDLYSLGLVAFFAATGAIAMSGTTPQRILVRQLTEAVPGLASMRPDLPPTLTDAVDRCVAKEPDDRFASAEALVESIDQAQLAAPEIPIPIRGFQQELSTLLLVIGFIAIVGWVIVADAPGGISQLDRMLPLVFIVGVVVARTLQTMTAARRVAELGFSPEETLRGLRGVMDESAQLRDDTRRDPNVHRRRRRTLIMASVQVPLAIGMMALAMRMRVEYAPGKFQSSPGGVALVLSGLLLFGLSAVLLVRSPFRMPPGERVFRLLWLGPMGRAFIRRASRGVEVSGTAARSGTTGAVTHRASVSPREAPSPMPQFSPPTTPTLVSLDARLKALEAWRQQQQ